MFVKRTNLDYLQQEIYALIIWIFQVGFQAIAEALGIAAVKGVVAIGAIIAGGRLVSYTLFIITNIGYMQTLVFRRLQTVSM